MFACVLGVMRTLYWVSVVVAVMLVVSVIATASAAGVAAEP
jgi:hypothetical protein